MITFAFEAQVLRRGSTQSLDATFLASLSDLGSLGAKKTGNDAPKIGTAFATSKADVAALLPFPTSKECNLRRDWGVQFTKYAIELKFL